MRKEQHINGLRWVHITRPTSDDLAYIEGLFAFHPLIKEAISSPTLHPMVEDFEDHLFLIAHFPLIDRSWQPNKVGEVDFLVTKDLLVTITYLNFRGLEEIFNGFPNDTHSHKTATQKDTGLLVHYIIDHLFQKLAGDLDFMEEEITRIEDKIFKKRDRQMVEEISEIRRDVLDFRRVLKPQSAVLKALIVKGEKFYGKTITPYLSDLLGTEERFENIIENQRETIEALHHTHESLMSSNLNNTIAILTVFSAIVLPLNFFASVWGMNHAYLPLRDGPYDFWIVMGLMAVIFVGLLVGFRRKGWL